MPPEDIFIILPVATTPNLTAKTEKCTICGKDVDYVQHMKLQHKIDENVAIAFKGLQIGIQLLDEKIDGSHGGGDADMGESLKNIILGVLGEIDKGFKKVMLMYSIAFYFGIFLILFSLIATLVTENSVANNSLLFFGGAGMIDIVAFFIFKPTKDLQKSRANLAQLVAAFIFWYVNTRNWNAATEKEVREETTNIDNLEKISKRHLIDTISILLTMYNMFADRESGENVTENIDKAMMKLKERIVDS